MEDTAAVAAAATACGEQNCCEGRRPLCKEYCLKMHAEDSQGDPGLALKVADDFMNTPWTDYSTLDLFIGGLTSDVSETLNQLLQHNGIPQISYGATSDSLGGEQGAETFPTFLRTVPSDGRLVNGIVALTNYTEWKQVSLLAIDREFGRAVAENLYTQFNELEPRVEVPANKLFTMDNVADHLKFIRDRTDSRVIFLHCSAIDALEVLKKAGQLQMLEEGYTWIGSEWASDTMFDEISVGDSDGDMFATETQRDDFLESLEGLVALRASDEAFDATTQTALRAEILANAGSDQAASNAGNDVFQQERTCPKLAGATHINHYAYFAYDAVLLGAHALHRSIAAGADPFDFAATMAQLQEMEGADTNIDGAATGSITLDEYGDRIMAYDAVNLVKEGEEWIWKKVGIYDECTAEDYASELCTEEANPSEDTVQKWKLTLYGSHSLSGHGNSRTPYDPELAIRWWDGSTMVPSDRKVDQVTLAAMYLSFFLSFIILSIVTGNFLHSKEFYVLPESGATILFGVLMGSVLKLVAHVSSHVDENELIQMTEFDTELFSLFLLPVIIFASGFNLRKKDFFSNLPPILLTAYFGTGLSTLVVGHGIYWAGNEGYFTFGSLGLTESLTFGALISAVDPVATLAVFGALGVETDLNMRVFGESVINDGVAIVLFKVFEQYITEEVIWPDSYINGVGRFFYIQFGSILVGMGAALGLAFVMKYARLHSSVLEASIVLIGSYVSYAGAEALHMSGIIASLFCGIAMNHWTYHNFTYDGEVLARRTVKMASLLADTVIFFQVGQNIIVHTSQGNTTDWNFIGWTLGLCFFSRAFVNILPFCGLYNLCASEEKKVPFKHQLVMIWAGLRGAIAFALALHFPSQHIHVIISTTMYVIMFTVFVNGGTCANFLELMDVNFGVASNDVTDKKKSKKLGGVSKNPILMFDRKVLLPLVTWRFEKDGNDTYIENPEEARAYRKGIPWEPGSPH